MIARALAIAGAVASLAGSDANLSLGGIAIGGSVLDAEKKFGMPGVVQTEDWGHEWQWPDAGGLDREVLTDDNMVVQRVLVAPRPSTARESPAPVAQPPEAPVLGLDGDAAAKVMEKSGGERVEGRYPGTLAWRVPGGFLVAALTDGKVARITAFDETTAHRLGFIAPAAEIAPHRAPHVLRDFTPSYVPSGSGTVIVRVALDAAGSVKEAKIVVPSGSRLIDEAELEHARRSQYEAATCDGVPCASVYMDIGWYWSGYP
jgi:TonB family protein